MVWWVVRRLNHRGEESQRSRFSFAFFCSFPVFLINPDYHGVHWIILVPVHGFWVHQHLAPIFPELSSCGYIHKWECPPRRSFHQAHLSLGGLLLTKESCGFQISEIAGHTSAWEPQTRTEWESHELQALESFRAQGEGDGLMEFWMMMVMMVIIVVVIIYNQPTKELL